MTVEATGAAETRADAPEPRRSDWRVLLVVFTLTGVIESQAFGHLNAFRPLYLQTARRPAR